MYTSRKVRRVVQDMSDRDFAFLLDDLEPEVRETVEAEAGRQGQAVTLVRHFDSTQSLGILVDMIREILPSVKF